MEKLKQDGVWGAVSLAKSLVAPGARTSGAHASLPAPQQPEVVTLASLAQSPTEQRNPRSMHLDTMPLDDAITLMVEENAQCVKAVLQ